MKIYKIIQRKGKDEQAGSLRLHLSYYTPNSGAKWHQIGPLICASHTLPQQDLLSLNFGGHVHVWMLYWTIPFLHVLDSCLTLGNQCISLSGWLCLSCTCQNLPWIVSLYLGLNCTCPLWPQALCFRTVSLFLLVWLSRNARNARNAPSIDLYTPYTRSTTPPKMVGMAGRMGLWLFQPWNPSLQYVASTQNTLQFSLYKSYYCFAHIKSPYLDCIRLESCSIFNYQLTWQQYSFTQVPCPHI